MFRNQGRSLEEQATRNIFTNGIFHGSTEEPYTLKLGDVSIVTLVRAVRDRAEVDGQWCIDNDLVGNNEDKMRRMIAYVSDPENIVRCVSYILKHNEENDRTVDFVCRDLANGSRR